ncbi:MAG: class I SAM-dependent methyltransferase [Cyanobacteriota bacterium]|nr:class I SAM-dependent methyltransferase [Cyanobacteriota bacterium]
MPQNTNQPEQFYGKDLAYVHDLGYGEIAEAAALFLLQQLETSNLNSGLIIDLGCGSGIFAKEICQSPNNYDFIGVDYSQDFLDIARQKAPKAQFIPSSFLDFAIPPCLAVTSIGECLNYQSDRRNNWAALTDLFQRIYNSLQPNGIFLFDLIEPGILGGNSSAKKIVERSEWTMFLEYEENFEEATLTRNITLFRKTANGYQKSKEIHGVKLYPRELVREALENLGFSVTLLDNYNGVNFRNKHVGFLAEKKLVCSNRFSDLYR